MRSEDDYICSVLRHIAGEGGVVSLIFHEIRQNECVECK